MSQRENRAWPAPLTQTSTLDLYGVGQQRIEDGKRYRWIKFDNGTANVASVVNMLCVYVAGTMADGTYVVTPDISDGGNGGAAAIGAGQFQAVIADGSYGWILVEGVSAILNVDLTAGAVGNYLTPVGAGDGTFDVFITGAIMGHFGTALDVTGSAQIIHLDCP